MRPRRHSLRARLVFIIAGGVLATSLLFGLAALAIAYSMEDRLFHRALEEEVAHQTSSWARTGATALPKNPDVAIHREAQTLPLDVREELAENPGQTEFFGREGRHYHLRHFDLNDGRPGAVPSSAIAVIEVSQDLLVRPYRDSIIQFLIWMSLVIAIVMTGFAWWFVHRAMKPLGDLATDIARADTSIPIIASTNYPDNEIGTLAQALEKAFERIRGFVDREQTFTRDASHELRTPLAVILGATEAIALKPDLPSHLVEPLRRIETATKDMALALDQLLALARENQGVQKETVALRPMIEKAVAWSRLRYPNSSISVSNLVDSGAAVLVHPTSLQLVLNNLIGNCFQHVVTGRLAVDFRDDCLSISDDGPGLEAAADPFAPYVKGTASLGAGLGLDISRRLCDAAGMGLTADFGKHCQGTSFRIVI